MRRGAFAPDFKNYTFGIVFQFSIDCLKRNFVSFFLIRRVFRTHVETLPLKLNLSPSFTDFRSVSVNTKESTTCTVVELTAESGAILEAAISLSKQLGTET